MSVLTNEQIKTFWQKVKNMMNPTKNCVQYSDMSVTYSDNAFVDYSYTFTVSRNNQPVYFLFSGMINSLSHTGPWISMDLYVDGSPVQNEVIQCKATLYDSDGTTIITNGLSNNKSFSMHYITTLSKGNHSVLLKIGCHGGDFDMLEDSCKSYLIIREV